MKATKKKNLSADLTLDEGSRSFVAKITSSAVDRHGEVLLPEGMDATDFTKNPVVFLGHDYQTLPVGKVTALKRQKDHWLATVKLADRPESHVGEWVPDTILDLVKQGVINGVSVGLEPIPGFVRRATEKDRSTFGDDVHTVVARWKLLELSIAPLPANQEALIVAVAKSLASGSTTKETASLIAPDAVKRTVAIPDVVAKRTEKIKLVVPSVKSKISAAVEKKVEREIVRQKGLLYT